MWVTGTFVSLYNKHTTLKKVFTYLLYVCEHTVAVFRHTRTGHPIPLQMVVPDDAFGSLGVSCGCWELNLGPLQEQ